VGNFVGMFEMGKIDGLLVGTVVKRRVGIFGYFAIVGAREGKYVGTESFGVSVGTKND
jgi:hypothetical protein